MAVGTAFPETRVSILQAAVDGSTRVRGQAIGQLFELYQRPIESYLRRMSSTLRVDPDDLVQGFFTDRVIQGNLLEKFERERGRFRSFLCTTLRNYVWDVCKHQNAKKRRPAMAMVDVDTVFAVAGGVGPGDQLEVDFVRATIARAMSRMQEECRRDGRMDFWFVLRHRTAAGLFGDEPMSLGGIVRALGLASKGAASNLLINAQRRLRGALRREVGVYADCDTDVDREIREYMLILSESY